MKESRWLFVPILATSLLILIILAITANTRTEFKLSGEVLLIVLSSVDIHETNNSGVKTTEIQTKNGVHVSISDLPGGLQRVLMWHGVEFKQEENKWNEHE